MQGITWWRTTLSNDDAYRLLLRQTALNFEPGQQYLYSNSNYLLLTKLVEVITGAPFVDYAGRLFADLGMHQTAFLSDHRLAISELARPYFNFDTWQSYEWLSDLHGDGALLTTLPDQLRYEQLRSNPNLLRGPIARSVIRSKGLPWPNAGTYGFGTEFADYRGQPVNFHNGSTGAWKATVLRFPDLDLAIVVMNNSGKFFTYDLARDVADVLLAPILKRNRYQTVPEPNFQPVANLSPAGVYGATEGYAIRVEAGSGDTLILHRFGRPDIRLEPFGEGIYRQVTDSTFYQTFDADPSGRKRITLYHHSHAPYSLLKTEVPAGRTGCMDSLLGQTFMSSETGVELNVSTGGDGLMLVLAKDTLTVDTFTERIWVTQPYTIRVESERDEPILYLFDDRLRWIRFDRVED